MCRQTAAREVVCKVGDGVGGGPGVAGKKGRMGKKKRKDSRKDSRKSWGSTDNKEPRPPEAAL